MTSARDFVLALTFGVILFTLLVQGATMRALVVHLRPERPRGGPSGC
jgi:NhaP-type Na+/H+ or K+/H+ antiporter